MWQQVFLLVLTSTLVGANDTIEDEVETLCDASFLQTALHTEQVLSVTGAPLLDARKPAPAEAPSFFQVDEVQQSAGEMTVSAEEALHGPGVETLLSPERLRHYTFFVKVILVLLVLFKGGMAFTRLVDRPKPKEVVPTAESLRAVGVEEPTPEALPTLTACEVQKLLPAFSGYDCALSKPKSLGQPFRLRARIYGPSESEPLVAPFTNEACVACSTQVQLADKATVILERSESVDFLATLEGAPDLQLTVHAQEVQMCVRGQKVPVTLDAVPERLREFVEGEMAARGLTETPLLVQEDVLRVGDMVTLVGDIHRTAAGQLLLWPCHVPEKRNRVWDLLDGLHVLVSDEENFGRQVQSDEAAEEETA